ncbi:epiplakin [Anolis sagrei]|uniref:epiplakin n=1 Tax=Anolis sagrei TaxID=38937 RepID=UPI0035202B22
MTSRQALPKGQVGLATMPGAGMCSRSIAGAFLEVSGKAVSLSDAVREHLLHPDLALSLLEAQAATGGIVDLERKELLPVAEAVARGLVGLEQKEKLLCAERAVTGFPDPYTEEKISLYQAIQKELLGKEHGLRLLEAQIATGGIIDPVTHQRVSLQEAYAHGYLEEDLHTFLSDPGNEEAKAYLDPNSNQNVTYAELMQRCVADPGTGLLLLPLKISFPGLRGAVCSHELLDSGVIDSATFRALHHGELTAQEVAEMDAVQQYLSGTNSIAGVAVLQTGECKSLYQALSEHLLMPGTAEILLQAQAATGGLIDPARNKRLDLDEAVRSEVVGPELYEKLSSAERAVTGYRDPCTGETLSLFQALKKGLVPKDPGLFLLEAQLATGGIVDPHTHHRLPVEVACQRGHLDKDTLSRLSQPNDDLRGFFDPNLKKNLSYAELLLRCVTDPDTGLCLFPLYGDPRREHPFIEHRTQSLLRNTIVPVPSGKFRGQPTSLWKLLFSDYFTKEQRRALLQQFHSGGLSTHRFADMVCDTVRQVSANPRITFEGLRSKVTPAQLLSSEIINKDLFEKLTQGETLAKDVGNMSTVKKYLEGTGSISGLLLPDSQERIGIYQAKRKGLLRPGTSLVLLEAQAATGHIIDPAANKKYSVNEALQANVIGPDVYDKLLAAEKAVTGYRDPYTGSKISLFQAMGKDLIVKEHAIRLLEAQIATGGIIDPVNSHRLPVEAAYKRGYFDKKMNLILSDPSDDTKGFFDPNTHENLTYLQLKEKCIMEPTTGLCLLPLNSKKRQFIDEATKQGFRTSWLIVKHGRFQGQRVSLWDLLNSEYFSEGKRREIFNHYRLQKLSLKQIHRLLEEEMKKWARIKFPAIRGQVTAYHLVETGIIDKALFERLLDGAVSPEEVLRMESVKKYLYGTGSIGGIVLQPSNERLSLYEAIQRNIVLPGVALPLLEAQAATGFIIDPVSNQKLRLDDAVKAGLVGPELYEKLQRAEEAVTGYKDPFTGQRISLFQAMQKGLVADKQAIQLMDAQMSTGGVIDPHSGHYVPVEFAQKKGYVDEGLCKALSDPGSDTKLFSSLDKKESVSYGQLMDQCQKDDVSGIHLLPLSQEASRVYSEEQIERLFRATLVEGRGLSLWELLHSGYFTEEQRRELFEKYTSEEVSLQQLVSLVREHIREMEMKARTQVTFQGLRGAVPAVWLLDTGIISEKTFAELAQGRTTAREVSEMESVRKYLRGTGAIAGVLLQSSGEKMGIYQAMQKSLLLPGTGTRLLEAQAASGSITDPAGNRRLDVAEAVRAGLVGQELVERLSQAERALVGYPDPYSRKPISVCQAIRKELIAATAGIPLLEAQLAAGGVIDPIHGLHLPLPAAYKHGFYDEDMHKVLSQHGDDTCVFFDPNTQESLTYQQLKDRCTRDAETGLLLLPLSDEAAFYGDRHAMEVLKSLRVGVNIGRYKGQEVSLWDLLNSEYIDDAKRRELVLTFKEENAEALQEIATAITKIIAETEHQGKRFAFQGLRKKVSASDLFQSQLIDKGTLDELSQGKKTIQEVTEMDSVRQYLEGGNFIAGVLLQPSQERMSICRAMRQGLLRPGAALVLLEAQAATGFLLDPVKNKKLSVDEALSSGLIGREVYEKLLSAEKAVTGYTDPYTKDRISLFEAMNQELIVRSHGIRLLEAQIATGGIIDPVHSHRIPVEVAYRRGYFDEELNRILLDPTDDTKGFFDPNTHENLTYLQLLERCVKDPETGLYMLQVVRRGGRYFYIDEATKQFLKSQPMEMHLGRYKGQAVSMWDLLCSPYIHEEKRKELVSQYKDKRLTLEQLGNAITAVVEETERKAQAFRLKGLREEEVSAAELFNAEIIDKKTLDGLNRSSFHQLAQKDYVKRFLEGTGCIAGVLVGTSRQKMSIYEAMKRGLLSPENALMFLEAQAATGFIVDPVKKKSLSVEQAISAGLVGKEVHQQLLLAERAVTGYPDPSTGEKASLYQAMKRNLVDRGLALRLLEAQMATGGIVDPFHSHRIPVEVAYKRGHLDDNTFLLLSDAEHAAKGFVDPNTQEKISYTQLLPRCVRDPETGMYLLQLLDKKEYFYVDEVTKNILSSTKVNVTLGKYKGQSVSLWELLSSDYVNEEKRKELIKKYKSESSAILQHIVNEIMNIIKEKEANRRDIWFQGLRKQVTASELLKADIIGVDTMKNLEEGKQSAQDVAKIESVKQYLEGTGCIAGVLVPSRADPSKMEKMAIYQAMWKGLLRPGTALVLLEAQAATGFITDPLTNRKLSVEEADAAGLVGPEILHKLLAAEKAVTGYTDPNTGKKISLFQALKKELILKEHGIRLLEAQIATGGIIDPVNSHRVPVEVAYKRGYFDEEMNQILLDPTEDTKGFFDPNTHENLTYKQLLKRCILDPDTGLRMLQVQPDGSSAFYLDEHVKKTLKSTTTRVSEGCFQGQETSVWDLLFSGYFTDRKREEILTEFRAGKLTIHEIITILVSTINEKENKENVLKTTKMASNLESADRKQPTLWEVLFSGNISEFRREELLNQFRNGSLTLEELINVLHALLTKAKAGKTKDPTASETSRHTAHHDDDDDDDDDDDLDQKEGEDDDEESVVLGEKEKALKSQLVEVAAGEFHGQKVSIWQILHSKYIPEEKRKELLRYYKFGVLTIEQMETIVTAIVNRTEEEKKKKESGAGHGHEDHWEDALRNHTVVLHVGEFQGQEVSLWDLLFSQYVPENQREELLMKYQYGLLSLEEMIVLLAPLLTQKESCDVKEADYSGGPARGRSHPQEGRAPRSPQNGDLKNALCLVSIEVPVGEFQGSRRSMWELLFSKYVTEKKRQMLLENYEAGLMSSEELVRIIKSLIEEMEKKSNQLKFSGLRRQVSASELFDSQIIDQDTLSELSQGTKTVEDITNMDSVKRYLEGRSCIAGVLVPSRSDPSKMEKVTIYQAMWKNILRPGTALVLLEAQAATGFITDPLQNRKLSVEEAVSAKLVGAELREKLLSAERAVTGYKDPYTGNKISLFQAMKKGLIIKDHGIRLLEAQIATGGIIDPVQSHRLPVEVAYQRGYFDEEMNRILSDPTDDTKGFFDPNTQENLTYMQLLQRCLPDPETGLLMLHVMDKASSSFHLTDKTRRSLQTAKTRVDVELFQGQEVSVWDLLFSRYIPPQKRQELLSQYKQGTIALGDLTQILTTIVTETEEKRIKLARQQQAPSTPEITSLKDSRQVEGNWQKTLRSTTIEMPAGENQGQVVTVWDLLFSNYLSEEKRKELLDLSQRGLIPVDQLVNILIALVKKGEATRRKFDIKVLGPGRGADHDDGDEGGDDDLDKEEGEDEDEDTVMLREKEKILKSRLVEVKAGEFHGRKVSVWEILHSKYIPEEKRKELLRYYKSGILTIEQMETIVTAIVNRTEEEKKKKESGAGHGHEDHWEDTLRNHTVVLHVGELQGQEVSLWDLLFSQYVPEPQREELLMKYHYGLLSIEEIIVLLAPLLTQKKSGDINEAEDGGSPTRGRSHPQEDRAPRYTQDVDLESALCLVSMEVPVGEFQGSRRSMWELLFSKYVTEKKRQTLLENYEAGLMSSEELVRIIKSLIEEMEKKSNQLKFSGLRRQVSASELFDSQIIDQDTLSELSQGTKTVEDITNMDSVKRYLEGRSCIAGVLVPSRSDPSKMEKVTIYQAMWKNILRPGTALVLLEAQAATGFITDPLQNRKLSVEEAVSAELVGAELREKLLSAERAVTGYKDPYTGNKISLFQAMKKGLIVKDHGIRLLEAQIATGGIIDPVQSHRLPVEVAYQRGYFDEEMNRILSDPTDDTKGFFDPNTQENLTYMQLLQRCLPDPETGLLMLHVMDKATFSFHLTEKTRRSLQTAKTRVDVELFQGQEVSVWDLLFSRYIPPQKRQELLSQYKQGTIALGDLTQILTTIVTETEEKRIKLARQQQVPSTLDVTSPKDSTQVEENWQKTLQSTTIEMPAGENQGQVVTVWDLLFSKYLSEEKRTELLDLFQRGLIPVDQLVNILIALVKKGEATRRKFDIKVLGPGRGADHDDGDEDDDDDLDKEEGEDEDEDTVMLREKEKILKSRLVEVAAGEFHGRKVSVWEILHSKYIPEEKRKELLRYYKFGILTIEQMETVVTTIVNRTEEEKRKKESGAGHGQEGHWEDALRNHTVVLHVGEFQGQEVSLWDLLFSQYVPETQREELLMKYHYGLLSLEEMIVLLAPLLTQKESGDVTEADYGSSPARGRSHPQESRAPRSPQDGDLERALRLVSIEVPVGEFQGSRRSMWELLFSKYVTEKKRQTLLENYEAGFVSSEELVRIIKSLIEEMEKKSNQLKFSGLRRQVSASELFDSQIIDQDTLSELSQGTKTVEDITNMDSVKRYLEGRSCIAGVLIPSRSDPSKMEKVTIYQAMWKNILRPGTALVLLEAQAATGFITDPLQNRKLSVEEAVSAELVGAELREKLLSAERAVTGYKDPYTGNKISLFQAMKKGLIIKDHGIRLLEAQIATGGIIDPVQSHRLPVEVAYQRGYFDEEMNRILSDPTDDTKGFFDPNTQENLTYMQLLQRCLPDPETGLLMLHVMDKATSSFHLTDKTRRSLQTAKTRVDVELFQGQEVSVWDLLFSRYIPPQKRQELLSQYKQGTIALEDLTQILTTIVTETEEKRIKLARQQQAPGTSDVTSPKDGTPVEENWQKTLQSATLEMPAGENQGQVVAVWDLLFSKYLSEEKRKELLDLFQRGLIPVDQLVNILIALVKKGEATRRKFDIKVLGPGRGVEHGDDDDDDDLDKEEGEDDLEDTVVLGDKDKALKSRLVEVAAGEFHGRKVSVWEILHSKYIPEEKRKELLRYYKSGIITIDQMETIVTAIVNRTEKEAKRKEESGADHGGEDDDDLDKEEGEDDDEDTVMLGEKEKLLKSRLVEVAAGEFHGRKVSVWEILHSKYIPEEKRKELLRYYKSGIITIDQMETIVTAIVNRTEKEGKRKEESGADHGGEDDDDLDKEEGEDDDEDTVMLGEKEKLLKSHLVEVAAGEFHGRKVSIWEILHSKYIPEEKRKELLRYYKSGIITIDQMETIVTAIVNRTEKEGKRKEVSGPNHGGEDDDDEEEGEDDDEDTVMLGEKEKLLKSRLVEVAAGEFHGRKVSVWEILHSKYIPEEKRKELLRYYKSGIITIDQMETIVTAIVNRTEKEGKRKEVSGPDHGGEDDDDEEEGEDDDEDTVMLGEKEKLLKSRLVEVAAGEFHGRKVSIWEILHSKYIPEEKRKELLRYYKSGIITIDQMETIVTAIVNRTEKEGKRKEVSGADHGGEDDDDKEDGEDDDEDTVMLGEKEKLLKSRLVEVAAGEFHGRKVSIWEILHSKYIPEEKRKELLRYYKSGIITIDQMETIVTSIVNRTEKEGKRKEESGVDHSHEDDNDDLDKEEGEDDDEDPVELGEKEKTLKSRLVTVAAGEFHGQKVSIWEVLHSKYIPEEKRKELLKLYKSGILSTDQMETVVTSIVNRTEEEKRKEESGTTQSHERQWEDTLQNHTVILHVGEFQGQEVSLRDLLFSQYISDGKREELLGIYRACQLTPEELTAVLSALITQVVGERKECSAPSSVPSGIMSSGKNEDGNSTEFGGKEQALKSRMVDVTTGELQGQKVSIWEILHSQYIPEEKQKELLQLYKSGILTIDQVESVVTAVVNRTEEKEHISHTRDHSASPGEAPIPESTYYDFVHHTLRQENVDVTIREIQDERSSLWDPYFSQCVSNFKKEEVLHRHGSPTVSVKECVKSITTLMTDTEDQATRPERNEFTVMETQMAPQTARASETEHQDGTELALKSRLIHLPTDSFCKEGVSLWDGLHSDHIPEEKKKKLLQLYNLGILTIDQMETAVTALVNRTEGEEAEEESHALEDHWRDTLQNHTVVLNVGRFQNHEVSLWDLLHSQDIPQEKREGLLNQFRKGSLTPEELSNILSSLLAEAKAGKVEQPSASEVSGLLEEDDDDDDAIDKEEGEEDNKDTVVLGEKRKALKSCLVTVAAGEFYGKKVSIWEVLHSKYIPKEKRKELLTLYKFGILSTDQMKTVVTAIVNRTEAEKRKEESGAGHGHESHWEDTLRNHTVVLHVGDFQGQEMPLWNLLFSHYIPEKKREELLRQHQNGNLSLEELANILSRFLAETKVEERKHHTTPETTRDTDDGDDDDDDDALGKEEGEEEEDPVELGEKEKALKSRLVTVAAGEFHGQKVSIWEVLHSKYIPEEKQKELLKLYKSGILSTDQMETVVTSIVNRTEEEERKEEPGAAHSHEDQWEDALRNHTVILNVGEFQGQEMPLRNLLFSQYIPEEKREELLRQHQNGNLSLEELANILSSFLAETKVEERKHHTTPETSIDTHDGDNDDDDAFGKEEGEDEEDPVELGEKEKALKSRLVTVAAGKFHGQKVSLWEVLHSKYIPEEKQKELLKLYKSGILSTDQMETVVTSIVNRTEEEERKEELGATHSHENQWEDTLRNHTVILNVGEFQGQEMPLWNLLFSQYIPEEKREELLRQHRNGSLNPEEFANILSGLLVEAKVEEGKHHTTPETSIDTHDGDNDDDDALGKEEGEEDEDPVELGEKEKALKSRLVTVAAGKFHGQKVSIWEVLHSTYIPEEKRKELLKLYKSGILSTDQMETVVTSIVNRTEEEKRKEDSGAPHSHEDQWEDALRNHTVILNVGEFQGQEMPLWNLLFSQYIPEEKREELLRQHRNGNLNPEELTNIVSGLLAESKVREKKHHMTPDTTRDTDEVDNDNEALDKEEGEDEEDPVDLGEKEQALKSRLVTVAAGEFHGQKVSIWEVLHSKYIPEEKRKELLKLYKSGILSIDQMETVVTSIVNRTEEESSSKAICCSSPREEARSLDTIQNISSPESSSLEDALRSESFVVPIGEFEGQQMSCWDVLSSKYVSEEKKQELLGRLRGEDLHVPDLVNLLTNVIIETERTKAEEPGSAAEGGLVEESGDREAQEELRARQQQLKRSLRTTLVPMSVGEFKGQKVCVLDLLFSKYVPQDKRQELLEEYRAGTLPLHEMVSTITTMIEEAESKRGKRGMRKKMSCMKGKLCWSDRGTYP